MLESCFEGTIVVTSRRLDSVSRMAWVPLSGTANTREVSGLRSEDGRFLCPRRLLRSDTLSELSQQDVDLLVNEYGVRAVIDLRGEDERRLEMPSLIERHPLVVTRFLPLLIEDDDGAEEFLLPWQKTPQHVKASRMTFETPYNRFLCDRPDSIVTALGFMSSTPGAVLINCAAGKDRTGVVVALLLAELGMVESEILTDFLASTERVPQILERLGQTRTYGPSLVGREVRSYEPRPENLIRLFANLKLGWGGVHEWLSEYGWTVEDRNRLQTKLLSIRTRSE